MDCREFLRGWRLKAYTTVSELKAFLTSLKPHERSVYLDALENGVLS